MSFLIGMDEAGYGPNLGPLVVTAVVWEVPGDPRRVDLWKLLDDVISQEPCRERKRLHIADSKQVYSPAKGLEALELGVLAAISLCQRQSSRNGTEPSNHPSQAARTYRQLVDWLLADALRDDPDPWHIDADLDLPHVPSDETEGTPKNASHEESWHTSCERGGIRLRAICSDVISPRRFNQITHRNDSKGRALSELSMQVLARAWKACDTGERVLVIADKHGGRNRYHEFLPIVFGDEFIQCREESLERSRYQVGRAEIRFETKSERHLPVALASMVCKYVRELSMVLFNRYWRNHLPELKPTAGYPLDATRFREEITATQRQLGIPDEVLWRAR